MNNRAGGGILGSRSTSAGTTTNINLGDPLPLPYKINALRDDDETAVETIPKNANKIRLDKAEETDWNEGASVYRTIPKRNREIPTLRHRSPVIEPVSKSQRHISESQLNKPVESELPFIKRRQSVSSNNWSGEFHSAVNNSDDETRKTTSELIRSIEVNINELHLRVINDQEIIEDLDTLEAIRVQVDKTIGASIAQSKRGDERHEDSPSILDELERLQSLQSASRYKIEIDYRYAIIFIVISLFLISSFIVSGLNYEYCYYFC